VSRCCSSRCERVGLIDTGTEQCVIFVACSTATMRWSGRDLGELRPTHIPAAAQHPADVAPHFRRGPHDRLDAQFVARLATDGGRDVCARPPRSNERRSFPPRPACVEMAPLTAHSREGETIHSKRSRTKARQARVCSTDFRASAAGTVWDQPDRGRVAAAVWVRGGRRWAAPRPAVAGLLRFRNTSLWLFAHPTDHGEHHVPANPSGQPAGAASPEYRRETAS